MLYLHIYISEVSAAPTLDWKDVYCQLLAFLKKKANRLKVPKSLLLLQFSAVPKHIDPI